MKELFYQIEYFERESEPRDVVYIRVAESVANEMCDSLKARFQAGYEEYENDNRDDWVESVLDDVIVCQYTGVYSFVPMAGVLFVD